MNNITLPFLLTTFAGFSTMIGSIFIFIKSKNENKIILSSLAFASGVMLSVSITDLIPESITLLRKVCSNYIIFFTILFIFIGIIFSMLIDYYLPTEFKDTNNKSLYKIGIISMLAIIIHNIPEGCSRYVLQ